MSIQSSSNHGPAAAAAAMPTGASAVEIDLKAGAAEGAIVPMELVGLIGEFAFDDDLEITQNASRDTIKIAKNFAKRVFEMTLAASFKLGSESTARLLNKSDSPFKRKVTICYGEDVLGTFVVNQDFMTFFTKEQDPIARPKIYIICQWMMESGHGIEHDGKRIDLKTMTIPVDDHFLASGIPLKNGRKASNWWKI